MMILNHEVAVFIPTIKYLIGCDFVTLILLMFHCFNLMRVDLVWAIEIYMGFF